MHSEAIEHFKQAALINIEQSNRDGNTIVLGDRGKVIISGDLHGHRRNFERMVKLAKLESSPDHHLILHEIIHGGPTNPNGHDLSHTLLLDVVKLKTAFPQQLHLLLGNHDLAQMYAVDILKDGQSSLNQFNQALEEHYHEHHQAVLEAMYTYFKSQPLAVRMGRVIVSHSLPGRREMKTFDPSILQRKLQDKDYRDGGSVESLVWGRRQTSQVFEQLQQEWNITTFINGHQPQETGFSTNPPQIILDSCHNHGHYMTLDLSKPNNWDQLAAKIKPLAAVA